MEKVCYGLVVHSPWHSCVAEVSPNQAPPHRTLLIPRRQRPLQNSPACGSMRHLLIVHPSGAIIRIKVYFSRCKTGICLDRASASEATARCLAAPCTPCGAPAKPRAGRPARSSAQLRSQHRPSLSAPARRLPPCLCTCMRAFCNIVKHTGFRFFNDVHDFAVRQLYCYTIPQLTGLRNCNTYVVINLRL